MLKFVLHKKNVCKEEAHGKKKQRKIYILL